MANTMLSQLPRGSLFFHNLALLSPKRIIYFMVKIKFYKCCYVVTLCRPFYAIKQNFNCKILELKKYIKSFTFYITSFTIQIKKIITKQNFLHFNTIFFIFSYQFFFSLMREQCSTVQCNGTSWNVVFVNKHPLVL